MSADRLQALERELRAPPPEGLATCDAEGLQHLAEAVARARRRQAAELESAGDQALRHMPRLLRIAIRKALG